MHSLFLYQGLLNMAKTCNSKCWALRSTVHMMTTVCVKSVADTNKRLAEDRRLVAIHVIYLTDVFGNWPVELLVQTNAYHHTFFAVTRKLQHVCFRQH